VWVLALTLVPVCAAALVFALAGAVAARHRAGAAADFAALAAAAHADGGATAACALARRVAADQRARLTRCQVADGFAVVEAESAAVVGSASASARAGPARAGPASNAPSSATAPALSSG